MNNRVNVLKFILDQGIEVLNKQDNAGNTALHLAYLNGNKDAVEYLISWGADKNIINNEGKTPIELDNKGLYTIPQNK